VTGKYKIISCFANLFRALKHKLAFNPTGLESSTHTPAATPSAKKSDKPARKRKRDRDEDSDSEDEVSTFRGRPAAKTNRPMIIPPVDKTRKQAIELIMAQVDPNAPFAERVAQFDTMEAIAKKRKSQSIHLVRAASDSGEIQLSL
jgi:hypothetical protein